MCRLRIGVCGLEERGGGWREGGVEVFMRYFHFRGGLLQTSWNNCALSLPVGVAVICIYYV